MSIRTSPARDLTISLEITNRTRWQSARTKLSGGPIGGIEGLNFGILPKCFREIIKNATYAVYSYETPIVVQVDGKWLIPDVWYGPTTGNHVHTVVHALNSVGMTWEKIPGPDGKRVKVKR